MKFSVKIKFYIKDKFDFSIINWEILRNYVDYENETFDNYKNELGVGLFMEYFLNRRFDPYIWGVDGINLLEEKMLKDGRYRLDYLVRFYGEEEGDFENPFHLFGTEGVYNCRYL